MVHVLGVSCLCKVTSCKERGFGFLFLYDHGRTLLEKVICVLSVGGKSHYCGSCVLVLVVYVVYTNVR